MSLNPESASTAIIELLAPAKNLSTAIVAINSGADAIYMGASGYGARKQASNSIEDVRCAVEYAHRFGARVYVTVNTIVYENELKTVEKLIWDLWRIGVDALIVQDLGLLEMHLPPIALHASTQCDIRTPEKARFLENCGFTQLVLPRELSIDEIIEFKKATKVPLEAFVHGALCVSYSGDCQASFVLTDRSANRGECAQICRYNFDLEGEGGEKIITGKHLLSLKDMNRLSMLEEMLEAGITSFKIEGRLKDEGYVKNVVAAYNQALDNIVKEKGGRFKRRARGCIHTGFIPDVTKSFNRGFTSYFLNNLKPGKGTLASFGTPKWVGETVATVERQINARVLKVKLSKDLNNGDGLGFFNEANEFKGFRLNRIDGNMLYAASEMKVNRGTTLYRNSDKAWSDHLEKAETKRIIPLDMRLRIRGNNLILDVRDSDGIEVSCSCEIMLETAKSPQGDARKRTMAKLGDTIFQMNSFIDETGDSFIPLSVLSNLRREGISAIERAYLMRVPIDLRHLDIDKRQIHCYKNTLTRHDNIANSLALKFYKKIAFTACAAKAIEVEKSGIKTDSRIMQTRYCLRRELGACLKTGEGKKLPQKLFLTSGNTRLRLEFDCSACRMNVHFERK